MGNNSKAKMKIVLALRPVLLFLAVLCFAANCQAKNDCPWLNEATVGGLLGGDAVGEFAAASAGQPAVCTFTQTAASFTRTLRITVEQTPDTHMRLESAAQACGKDAVSLRAIGNEASMCTLENRNTGLSELVVGRVRDQLFTITVATTLKNDPILTRETIKDKANTVAEQVAGNLF